MNLRLRGARFGMGWVDEMSYSYRNGRRGSSPFLRVLLTIASLAAVSFGAAFLWQQTEDSILVSAADVSESSGSEASSKTPESSDASIADGEYKDIEEIGEIEEIGDIASSGDAADSEASEVDSEPESEASSTAEESSEASQADGAASSKYARDIVAGAVAASKPVGYGYFDDAIFFGDSISVGIPLYMQTMVPNTAVIAAQGVSPGGALTSECISTGGSRVTMLTAAKSKGERSKVYIMLGANALDYDEATLIAGYTDFLLAVKAEYPEAVIYVQSILPVTATVNNVYPSKNINNDRIAEYNKAICRMATANGAHYVDVAQGIVDENGMLPTSASPLDGMHLSPEYYLKWFDYLRSHTVNAEQ